MKKDLAWYKAALESQTESHRRVTDSYVRAQRKLDAVQSLLERTEAVDSRWVDGVVLAAILRQED